VLAFLTALKQAEERAVARKTGPLAAAAKAADSRGEPQLKVAAARAAELPEAATRSAPRAVLRQDGRRKKLLVLRDRPSP
jgi:hypothetical protein